ncbi:MAG: hypothetical protein ACRELA_13925 [Candidatus Rokuibacteriota bacterium]
MTPRASETSIGPTGAGIPHAGGGIERNPGGECCGSGVRGGVAAPNPTATVSPGARVGGRLAATFGGVSGSLGAFGTLHNVCHYTCQLVVAGLALSGITLAGLPLAFLEDPRLIVLFGGMGTVSLGASMTLHVRTKRTRFAARGLRRLFDRRMVVLLAFLLLSGWSVTQGAAQMFRASGNPESPIRRSKDGSVEVELTLLARHDASATEGLVFELAMNAMDMSAPSFEALDLKGAIALQIDGGPAIRPAALEISDWGHMGHHARGRVVFPKSAAGTPTAKDRLVRVTVRGIGGVETRVFEWGPRTTGR